MFGPPIGLVQFLAERGGGKMLMTKMNKYKETTCSIQPTNCCGLSFKPPSRQRDKKK
jgi:hypothetical protein